MSYTPYRFKIDVHKKTFSYDNAGQAIEAWEFDRTIKCVFMPSRGEERLVGRIQNPRSYMIWTADKNIDYSDMLTNLRDRTGEVVEEMDFNVIGIKRFVGWAKVHHLEINLQARLN